MAAVTDCDGVPTDLQSDPAHCGYCTWKCLPTEVCSAGQCACPAGRTKCFDACQDYSTDSRNCGGCRKACASGERCEDGACCTADKVVCGGACVDPRTNHLHCGACGQACPTGHICTNSACVPCPKGLTACDGRCVDVSVDGDHCGVCGRTCKPKPYIPWERAFCTHGRCVERVDTFPTDGTKSVEVVGSELITAVVGVHRMPVTGGTSKHLTGSVLSTFAVEGSNVYVLGGAGALLRYDLGTSKSAAVGFSFPVPGVLRLGGGYAYSGRDRGALAGGPVEEVLPQSAAFTPAWRGLATDASHAYYVTSGKLLRIAHVPSAAIEVLAAVPNGYPGAWRWYDVDAADRVTGGLVVRKASELFFVPVPQGLPTVDVLSGVTGPSVVRDDTVWVATPTPAGTWVLVRKPMNGEVEEVAASLPPIDAFAFDAKAIYFFTKAEPGIWRITPR